MVEVPIVVVLAPGQLLRRPLSALANAGVIADGLGPVGGEEYALDELARARLHAPIMEHELFRMTVVAQLFQAACHLCQGLVPRDSFPLAFAALADTLHRIEHAVRVVDLVDAGVALGADKPLGPDRVRLAAHLH
jgi:hypothetical protein